MSKAIETSGVCYRPAKDFEIKDLSLSVPTGSVYGFLGPNGSGKTTTIRLLMGQHRAERGSIQLLDRSVPGEMHQALQHIGYVPERPHLYPSLTVVEAVQYHSAPNAPDAFVRFLEERLADFVSTVPRQPGSVEIFLSTSREVAAASPTLARYGGLFHPSNNYSVTSLMPPSVDGRSCLMLITLTDRAVSLESSGTTAEQVFRLDQRSAGTTIGPCAFFAVFGQPGKGVQGWLRQTAFVWALRPSFASSAGRSTLDVLRQTTGARSRSLVERASFDAVGCAAGDEARCLRAVRSPVAALPIRMGAAQQLPPDWATSGTNPWTRVWFAGEEEYFLSDMVESLGYDRFQAFWSSDAPLDEAFAAATGIPLGRWTADWARRTIGSAKVGPWPGRASTAIALAVTFMFAVAGAFIASRRTI